MFMKRFFEPKLAQTSYVIGCPGAKAAIVIDANRDIEQYIRAAESEGVSITHVTETHIHADYVSGSRELAARTGAQLLLSDEGDASWKYVFAKDAGATLLKDGDRITALHVPGQAVRFFHNGRATAEVGDAAFADSFFGIWLSPKTSEPKLRARLLSLR
jgi:hydroxyacylglutathione hydrolase